MFVPYSRINKTYYGTGSKRWDKPDDGEGRELKIRKKTAEDLNKLITSVGKNCCSCWNAYHNTA